MLTDKVILISGSTGLDALLKEFQRQGAVVAADSPGADLSVSFNPNDPDDTARAAGAVTARYGRIDGVVHSHHSVRPLRLEDCDPKDFIRELDENVRTAFVLTQTVGGILRRQKAGRILYISSIHDQVPTGCAPGYSVAKAALKMLAKEAALDLGLYGVQVLGIEAGALAGNDRCFESSLTGRYEAMANKLPDGRVGTWDDIAPMAAFLLGDACRHINGEFVRMDGAFDLFYLQARDPDDDRVEGVRLYGV